MTPHILPTISTSQRPNTCLPLPNTFVNCVTPAPPGLTTMHTALRTPSGVSAHPNQQRECLHTHTLLLLLSCGCLHKVPVLCLCLTTPTHTNPVPTAGRVSNSQWQQHCVLPIRGTSNLGYVWRVSVVEVLPPGPRWLGKPGCWCVWPAMGHIPPILNQQTTLRASPWLRCAAACCTAS